MSSPIIDALFDDDESIRLSNSNNRWLIGVDVTLDDVGTLNEDAKSIAIQEFGNADEFEIINSEFIGDVIEPD